MGKVDRLLNNIEEQKAVVLDPTPMGTRVRPTYADAPEEPVYIVEGKEFRLEIETGILYSVAYYHLKESTTDKMHYKPVAAYEIVRA
jgi:hypothetical protein